MTRTETISLFPTERIAQSPTKPKSLTDFSDPPKFFNLGYLEGGVEPDEETGLATTILSRWRPSLATRTDGCPE